MLNLGISSKIKVQIDPKEGFPKVISVTRILQGEPIETVCGHDLNIIQAKIIFSMSPAFSTSIRPNPIKSAAMNAELDQLMTKLRSELLESDSNITHEALDQLSADPRFLEKMENYHWIDFLTGNISLYTVSEYPNVDIEWNEKYNIWQVVAIREILPEEILSLPKPKE